MITRFRSGRLAAATRLLVLAILVVGCAATGTRPSFDDPGEWVGGTTEDARAIVEHWLAAASTGSGDLGWGLIYPRTRDDVTGSEDAYRRALGAGDWSAFEYEVAEVRVHDGEYLVDLRVHEAPTVLDDWRLVQFAVFDGVRPVRSADGRRISGTGIVTVRIGTAVEGSGVQGRPP